MKTPASKLSRRSFLFAVGAGGVATAAALAGRKPQSSGSKVQSGTGGKGYQLTEHVRKYYSTTRV